MVKKIIVLATTAKEAGALSILKDFIQGFDEKYFYDILISPNVIDILPKKININYIYLNTSSWKKRIFFDLYKYPCIDESKYSLCVNFQNIPIRTNIKQIVYYHQAIPFSNINFSPLKKDTRKLWLYKNFYLLFFKINIKHLDYLIVQAEWLKESIIKKLNFPRKNIFIIKPKVNINPNKNFTIVNNTLKNKDFNILFYPAYGHEYKNHKIIIDSIKEIGIKYLEKNNVRIVFTIEENHKLAQEIKKTSLNKYFIFTGKISREKVFYYYRLAKIVLFPSVLETYGLPLKEALVLNKNIIVSRLPYAEEVLSNYNKAIFCNPYNRIDWISNIKKLLENKEINFYNREQEEVNSNNNEFLSLIKKLIKE